MFPNLNAELARYGLTESDVATWISCTPKTVKNKLNGQTEFTLSEILAISSHFHELSISYLFEIKTTKSA